MYTHRFNGHFLGQPRLASCSIDSRSPVSLILSILTGQTTFRTHNGIVS